MQRPPFLGISLITTSWPSKIHRAATDAPELPKDGTAFDYSAEADLPTEDEAQREKSAFGSLSVVSALMAADLVDRLRLVVFLQILAASDLEPAVAALDIDLDLDLPPTSTLYDPLPCPSTVHAFGVP